MVALECSHDAFIGLAAGGTRGWKILSLFGLLIIIIIIVVVATATTATASSALGFVAAHCQLSLKYLDSNETPLGIMAKGSLKNLNWIS